MKQLLTLMAEEKEVQEKIRKRKRYLHKEFYKLNKKKFWCLDIMVILIVLMNFGAAFTTSFMIAKTYEITKTTNTVRVVEANPIQAKVYNLEPPNSEALKKYFDMFKFLVSWSLMVGLYLYFRMTTFTVDGLYILLMGVSVLFFVLGYDFFHDLGSFVRIVKW